METSISDHHALIFSFLKTAFTKMPPNKFQIRNLKHIHFYKIFNNYPKNSYTERGKHFGKTLNKHVALKTKVVRRNNKSFITKNMRKAIMKRSALKKRTNISNNPEIIKLYKNKETVNLSRKVKKEYFQRHMPPEHLPKFF